MCFVLDKFIDMSIITHMRTRNRKPGEQTVLELARNSGVVSASDARSLGVHPEYLRRLCAKGQLVRIDRGLYRLPDAEVTAHHGLVRAAKAIPKGVVCLLSALRFHEIGTHAPREVWVAINRRAARPRIKQQKVRIVLFSGKALTEGVETHMIEGVQVNIYGPAKTVADCFKYRNKIGLDVALEALRDVLRGRKCSTDDLWKYAKICRVTKTMRPYMEATV
ncbi:MAG: type IV toxin-antitoxin system AbiEi family antitoxin domain-containing protein [Planctomycetota bacterium]